MFEQRLIGEFSCVNARLVFDSRILLPQETLKLIWRIRNEREVIFEDKRVMTEILKMDENNQYGNAMTKALPTGSVKKEKKVPTLKEFDLIIQGILD